MKKYQNNKNVSSGMGLGSVLTVIFIVLKLCGLIDWSWWWVLSPVWISIGLALVIILIVVICCAISDWIDEQE